MESKNLSDKPLISEKYIEMSEKTLTDEEALAWAKKFNIKNFSLDMDKTQKVRVKVSSLCCPVCQSKDVSIDRVRITRSRENDNHRMVCNSCDVVTTLWHVALADHYRI